MTGRNLISFVYGCFHGHASENFSKFLDKFAEWLNERNNPVSCVTESCIDIEN